MIRYDTGGWHFFTQIFKLKGSVFPRAMFWALPAGLASGGLSLCIHTLTLLPPFHDEDSITRDSAAWSGFSFLVGFLIVFRTSQAYDRFWAGCSCTHKMRAEWFDGCAAVISFLKYSEAPQKV